jgi:hypothetical protein
MARYVLVVLANPVEGMEREFGEWYDEVHIPEVLSLPGVISAERFELANDDFSTSDHRCLVLYECDVESPAAAWDTFKTARADGRTTAGKSMDRSDTKAWFFTPVGAARG